MSDTKEKLHADLLHATFTSVDADDVARWIKDLGDGKVDDVLEEVDYEIDCLGLTRKYPQAKRVQALAARIRTLYSA